MKDVLAALTLLALFVVMTTAAAFLIYGVVVSFI